MRQTFLPLAAALLLAGCGGTLNRGVESVHQPVVSRTEMAMDLWTSGGALAAGEDARLDGWLRSMRVGYGDRVSVADPAGAAPRARQQVGGAVAAWGLLLQPDAPVASAPVPPAMIRVVLSRTRATVPGCPDWSRDSSNEFEASTSSNYGCATNANLAAMVADPEDLLRGHDGRATGDPSQIGKAIRAYRDAVPGGGGGQTIKSEKAGSK